MANRKRKRSSASSTRKSEAGRGGPTGSHPPSAPADKQASRRRLRPLLAILAVLVVAWLVREVLLAKHEPVPLRRPDVPIAAQPLAQRNAPTAFLFERLSPAATGIDFTSQIDNSHPMRYLYETGFTGGGVAIGDVNGDGWPDVYFVSGPDANRLYLQTDGEFRFEDVTEQAGVDGGNAWGAGAAMADVNNDGRLDIYVCNYDSPNLLYINQGDGTFREQARDYGLDMIDACLMAAFCDYDLDGDLDMYLLCNRYVPPQGRPARPPVFMEDGRLAIRPEYQKYYDFLIDGNLDDRAGRSDGLFRNNGNGTFTDVSEEAGLWGRFHGLSVTWWDDNEDGLPDIYVANDFNGPDQHYRNNGHGAFSDVTRETVLHIPWFGMGADAADVDNNGRVDLLVADMARTSHLARMTSMVVANGQGFLEYYRSPQYMTNSLYLNMGVDRFMEVAHLAGADSTNWTWAVKLADFDNDGRVDMFFSTGFTKDFSNSDELIPLEMETGRTIWDLAADQPVLREANIAFRNLGDLQFEEVSRAWGLDEVGVSMAVAYADLDRDGDLDMIVANAEGPPSVYRNGAEAGHGILIRLEGAASNRFGLGATVRVKTKLGEQVRWLSPMTGYNSSNEPLVHFGLSDAAAIDELTVDWPSGHRQVFHDLTADQLYTIVEPDGDPPARTRPLQKAAWFRPSRSLREVIHRERPFDDFQYQQLLPNKLSQLGPGMAWGDVDQDGGDDLFLGGAAGEPGQIWQNNGGGRFEPLSSDALLADRECEDMGAVWLDADGDGDLDLYVVSGGVEFGARTRLLRDRLYWNDGQGQLTNAAADVLPPLEDSGGPVAAADFDRDGDVDLFVGGRILPGEYPLSPKSRLLRNEGGRFTDVTESAAPELLETGMVTAAIWSDVDADGWLDLLVAHEWGPLKLYRNEMVEGSRRLVDRSEAAGLSRFSGWWNGITGRDIDGDGDIDYVATNFGLNTKYRATPESPARLYYGDFGGGGEMHVVEAYEQDGTIYPVRDQFFTTQADPFLKERFPTNEAFGRATLEEIYSAEALSRARLFSINTLESGVFLNDGRGVLEFRPLPRLAQASPGFGLALSDFDLDGRVDLYIVQNFFSPQPSTGRMDGGLSLLLRGDGQGVFTPVPPDESGLVVPGDAKSLTLADVNGDGRPDFIVGVNNADVMAFESRGESLGRPFRVRLRGKLGNPTGIGSRITVHLDDDATQTAEVYAGEGYLSQSSSEIAFGVPSSRRVDSVEVRWPDGETTTGTPDVDTQELTIQER